MHAALRAPVVALGATTALVLLPGAAAADVSVAASVAEAGARNVTITFRVTNPDPAVPTTRLQVFLPTVHPLVGVRPTAPTGWTAQVRTGPAGETPAEVSWNGGTVAGARYAVFPVDVDRLPDGAGPLRFRVVQTFANGATEEWSDLVPYGAPAPAHPALTVPYSASAPPPPLPAAAGGHHHGDTVDLSLTAAEGAVGRFAAIIAIVVALVAGAVQTLGRRQRRRMAVVHDAATAAPAPGLAARHDSLLDPVPGPRRPGAPARSATVPSGDLPSKDLPAGDE